MMPNDRLSTFPVAADLLGPDRFPFSDRVAYTLGPKALQDISAGLENQVWRIRLIGDEVFVTSPTTPETLLFSKRNITQVSLAFDQNARHLVAYVVNATEFWLYWYDPIIQAFTHTQFDTGIRDVHACMPDKREFLLAQSDIGLFYTKDDGLYARWQIDRYQIPYLLQSGVGGRLMRVGMSANYRLQFIFQAQPYDTYSCTLELGCL